MYLVPYRKDAHATVLLASVANLQPSAEKTSKPRCIPLQKQMTNKANDGTAPTLYSSPAGTCTPGRHTQLLRTHMASHCFLLSPTYPAPAAENHTSRDSTPKLQCDAAGSTRLLDPNHPVTTRPPPASNCSGGCMQTTCTLLRRSGPCEHLLHSFCRATPALQATL
mmetsp:Transcript_10953/g.23636  ORF Transcript_10953/g.23636 Transcript_10953/m.23636 type:complete len:166 (-) Transcript_10953:1303-1800(-)